MKLDTREIRTAMARLASASGKNKRDIAQRAAKGFIKDVVSITPPASRGSTGAAAKKAGEAAIDVDTALTMEKVPEKQLRRMEDQHGSQIVANQLRNKKGRVYLEDLNHIITSVSGALDFHLRKRNKNTGRVPAAAKRGAGGERLRMREAGAHNAHVGRWKADDIALVPPKVLAEVRKILKRQVGILAAGWNAGAKKLGVKLPAWVTRHGTAFGECVVTITRDTFRIELGNVVNFVGNVKGYERRMQRAVDFQAAKMQREADYLVRKAIKQSGW